jgi:hypothetical protein
MTAFSQLDERASRTALLQQFWDVIVFATGIPTMADWARPLVARSPSYGGLDKLADHRRVCHVCLRT